MREYLEQIVRTMDENKAQDINVIYIGEQSSIADYFVICSSLNKLHSQGIAQKIEKSLKDRNVISLRQEGYQEGEWILQDYGDIIIQIFKKDIRDYYDLDKLWQDAESVNIDSWLLKD